MSFPPPRQYVPLRSRPSSVVLLAMLLGAAPHVVQAQRQTATADSQPQTKTATGGLSRAKAAATSRVSQQQPATQRTTAPQQPATPVDSTPKQTPPPRKRRAPAEGDSSFLQRFLAALASGMATRDSTSRQPQQPLLMPNLVGRDTLTALKVLAALTRSRKVRVSYVIAPPAPTLNAVDRIEDQYPAPDDTIGRVLSVRLTLAGLPRPTALVTVPRLIGLPADSAVRLLRARGLVEDRLERGVIVPDSIGLVTGQNPQNPTQLKVGGTVAIAIGKDARVFMPKVTDLTLAQARQRVSAAGIDVARIRRASVQSARPSGSVVQQVPEPGSVVLPTTRIVLTQAIPLPVRDTTQRTAVMPFVVGRDTGTALRILRGAGLRNLRLRAPVNRNVVDTVRVQLPDSGQRIAAATTVVLTLGADLGPFPPLPGMAPEPDPLRWPGPLPLAALALTLAAGSALTARRIWPPPQIVPQIRIEPMFSDILGVKGSLVGVSISLRSHVEHEQAVLDLTGSSLD